MWPAVAAVSIALITLLGLIQQKNPEFYRKVEMTIFGIAFFASSLYAAFIHGHNYGVNKVIEMLDATLDEAKYETAAYDETLALFAPFLPILIMFCTGLIGYIAKQLAHEKKI